MGLDEIMQKQIALAINKLQTETNPKKIEKIFKALIQLGLTEEEIDYLTSVFTNVSHRAH